MTKKLMFRLQTSTQRKLQHTMTAKCSNQLSTFVNLQIRLIPQLKELASRWATASLSNVQHSRSSISEWEKKKLNLFINELVCDLNDKKQRLSKEHVNNQVKCWDLLRITIYGPWKQPDSTNYKEFATVSPKNTIYWL